MSGGDAPEREVVVIGAGPAGLAAAWELAREGLRPVVLEKRPRVGGLAGTEAYRGFHFDLGGHRFFTKVDEVERLWREALGPDLLRRPRLSRIYYNGRFFNYPLKPWNALGGLGVGASLATLASYLRWQVRPHRREDTFEQWVTNRFGRRLFRTFFQTYTEKVWGIPCSELGAEWAAQRIKDLSLTTAILNMFVAPRRTVRTLIEEFHYPRLGPGMMWNAVRAEVERRGGRVRIGADVVAIGRTGRRVDHVVVACDGVQDVVRGSDFVSSMPITELVARLDPPPPPEVCAAAARLTYRDFLTVCLIVDRPDLFPDNWIYVHDPAVQVGRIQNFKNWSPDMVPDPRKTSLGLEYFCREGDALWSMADADLVALASGEIERIGLARAADVEDGCVVRVPKAYPVYDAGYREPLAVVRAWVDGLENLQTIGRNGLHRYDNQDHAMVTGLLAARRVTRGERASVWDVNTDGEYHEEVRAAAPEPVRRALAAAVARLDRVALGWSVGVVAAAVLALMTLVLVVRGGPVVGPMLGLLGQYFPGYRVTLLGSVVGGGYGFLAGFALGVGLAAARNTAVGLYLAMARGRARVDQLRGVLDHV